MSNCLKYALGNQRSSCRSKREAFIGFILVLAGAILMTALVGSVGYADLEDCRQTGICWGM